MLAGRVASPIKNTIGSPRQPLQLRALQTNMTLNKVPAKDRDSFIEHLQKSNRILALCGAGLSASSGLPTFRGAGGIWRNHEATSLATPEAFEADPALVWQFYSYRRHMALNANPNPAHYALAELARKRPKFVTLSQNVDGQDYPTPKHLSPEMLTLYFRTQSAGQPS